MNTLTPADLADLAAALESCNAVAQLPERIAASDSVCGNCNHLIKPGHKIVKRPGRAWQHQDCANVGRRQHQDDNTRRRRRA